LYIYVAHMGAVWRFNAKQFRRVIDDIKKRQPINLEEYGGRLITGRLYVLENLMREYGDA
jgi:hypothetical protein